MTCRDFPELGKGAHHEFSGLGSRAQRGRANAWIQAAGRSGD